MTDNKIRSVEKEIISSHEKGYTWRLWPFFLLHISSGLSGIYFSCHLKLLIFNKVFAFANFPTNKTSLIHLTSISKIINLLSWTVSQPQSSNIALWFCGYYPWKVQIFNFLCHPPKNSSASCALDVDATDLAHSLFEALITDTPKVCLLPPAPT